MKKLFFLVFAMTICTFAFAQNDKESKKEQYEKRMAEIQSLKIAFFTKHLHLTSEEAQEFWPVYNNCEKERDVVRRAIRKSGWDLYKATKDESKSDDEIRQLADEYYGNLAKDTELQRQHYSEYQKVLPVKKAAKVRMVEEMFINDLLARWKKTPSKDSEKKN